MHLFFQVDKKKRKRGLHRKKRHLKRHHIREWLYPTIGFKAFLRLLEIQIKRTHGSVHAISFGVAAGTFASFTPFMGLHSLFAVLLCVPFRGNYLIAVLATLVGNPWTFPFIWVWIYYVGNKILGRTDVAELPSGLSFSGITENFAVYFDTYLWPMVVGGVPTGLVVGTAFYALVYINISSYRRIRERHLKGRRILWMKHLAGGVVYFAASKGKNVFTKTLRKIKVKKKSKGKHKE